MSANQRPCVLIVDDDPDLAEVMRFGLGRAGFEVHSVNSGQAALRWIGDRVPDVLVLDLMMPDMNGFAVLRQLRAAETANPLPVVVITARADQQSRAESQAMGANAFLTKPVRAEALVQQVRQALTVKTADV